MPVAAIISISDLDVQFQWFTEKGKHRHESSIRWADVTSIKTFKRDMFAYDLICIRLESCEQEYVEFDEEDANWQNLMSALPIRLPGCRPWGDWFSEVAFPAFQPNETLLFRRNENGA
jgi:hypothetical protein